MSERWLFHFKLPLYLFRILLAVLNKRPNHHNHNYSDWEGGDNADRLDVVHGAFREDKADWKDNQKYAPQEAYQFVWLFVFLQILVAVAGRCVGNGVERGCVEGNHADKDKNQDKDGARDRVYDV